MSSYSVRWACRLSFTCGVQISAVLKGRSLKYFMTRLPSEVLRSSVFLAANCFFFLGFFCLHR